PETGAGGRGPRRDGVVMTVASFDLTDGRVTRVWAVRNPEKLRPWARHDMS
ncbi:RNA polymerase subunit sigma-24, partial [Streptomyces rubiginosohelvolus]